MTDLAQTPAPEREDPRTSPHPFRSLVETTRTDSGLRAYIDDVWTIGDKVHGGCLLAVCASGARTWLRDEGVDPAMQPVAVSVQYVRAPSPGWVDLEVEVRSTGRQIAVADVVLSQDGRTAVRATVTLGLIDRAAPRYSAATTRHPSAVPGADAAVYTADHPIGSIVHLGAALDLCGDPESAPFLSGRTGDPEIRTWLRPREGDTEEDTAVLVALMTGDVSPPVTLNRGMFGWAPTVQLTVYLRAIPAPGWLRVTASSTVVGERWFEEDHTVLDETGAVVVQSRQLAMIPR